MATERPTRMKGRGRWREVSKPFYGDVALGNGTQYKIGCWITERNELFVGVEGKGCYTFPRWTHPSYVKEKLGLRFDGDAKNFADFINHQLGGIAEDYEEEGEYQDQFCGEVAAYARSTNSDPPL